MHELSITQEIVNTAEDARRNAAPNLKVIAVRLKIGRLTAIVPDCITFYFEMLTKDTPLQGAEIIIEIVPISCHCIACQADFTIDEPALICPGCGSTAVEITAGRELLVDSIEVDEPEK